MRFRLTVIALIVLLLALPIIATAESQYGKIDVYCNDELYPGASTPKPVLKIGEPFTLRFDMTMYQECQVSAKLSDLGTYQGMENFVVIDGPAEFGERTRKVFAENETYTFEWILEPTEEWAEGSMPINFVYQINDLDTVETLVNSEFTAAVPYITNEHYEGTSSATTSDPAGNADDTPSTPAFTLPLALIGLILAAVRRR